MRDDDLTPQERDAFAALPREGRPSDLLEERTVRALRAEGLLGTPRRRGFFLSQAGAAAAIAATLALTVGGFALGRVSGARAARAAGPAVSGTAAVLVTSPAAALQAAADVQRAGSAYVAALTTLRLAATGPDTLAARQGREAALSTLAGAVNLVVEMAPDHPLAGDLLLAMERGNAPATADGARGVRRELLWF